MRSRPVPSEERLERLIFEAYEYRPGPDMARLQSLEARLLRQAARRGARRKTPRMPWWLILLLAGGAATAAWWSVERLQDRRSGAPPERPPPVESRSADPFREERTAPPQDSRPAAGRGPDSPLIDKREGP